MAVRVCPIVYGEILVDDLLDPAIAAIHARLGV
jgi:hypothetical protein